MGPAFARTFEPFVINTCYALFACLSPSRACIIPRSMREHLPGHTKALPMHLEVELLRLLEAHPSTRNARCRRARLAWEGALSIAGALDKGWSRPELQPQRAQVRVFYVLTPNGVHRA